MKNIILILGIFISVGAFTSCDSFLDQAPDDRMTIKTLDDVDAVMAEAYDKRRTYCGLHFATDDAGPTTGVNTSYPILNDIYSWKKEITDETHQDNPASFWRVSYASIANSNLVLESIGKMSETEQNSQFAMALKAEALITRAYHHFMLLNTFAKPYNATTANTDKGIPYVIELEKKLIQDYERGTVESTYAKVIEDYEAGIQLMEKSLTSFNKNKYRVTIPTAYAIGGRIYLWRNKDQQDNEKSKTYAAKAIEAHGGVVMMRKWSDYKNDERGIVDANQAEVGWVQNFATWITANNIYQITISTYNSVKEPSALGKDLRDNGIRYTKDGDIYIPSYYFATIDRQVANDLFPLSESLLNKIEAEVRLDDFVAAKADMNSFLSSNHDAPLDFTDQDLIDTYSTVGETPLTAKEAWIQFLLSERRRQFHMKGMRWFDIHRYQINIKHRLQDGTLLQLQEELPHFAFEIPQSAINTGLPKNY